MQDSTIKIIRRGPVMMLTILIMMLALVSVESYRKVNKVIKLHVETGNKFPEKRFQRITIGKNTFEAGSEGVVYWKPESFTEAFILQTIVNDRSGISLINIIYFLMLNALYFWMVSGVQTDNIFRLRQLNWISIPGFILLTWAVKNSSEFFICNYVTSSITNGYFRAPYQDSFSVFNFMILFLIPFLQPFMTKARQLETDQNLTI